MPQTTPSEGAPVTSGRFAGTKRYLTPKEAAEYLCVGHSTLSIHRMNGTGPKFIKWGHMNVRYDIQELDRWMAEHTVTPAPRRRAGRPRKTEVAK